MNALGEVVPDPRMARTAFDRLHLPVPITSRIGVTANASAVGVDRSAKRTHVDRGAGFVDPNGTVVATQAVVGDCGAHGDQCEQ